MSNDDWAAWSKSYFATMALGSQLDIDMLAAWKPEFIRHELADLEEAWARLKDSNAVLKWRGDHRRFLHIHLNDITRERAKRQVQQVEDADERYRCKQCWGSGHVMIPHPAAIRDGIWDYKTELCIACNCQLGFNRVLKFNQTAREHSFGEMKDIPWADHTIPDWREMMMEKQRRLKDSAAADDYTKRADKQGIVKRDLFKVPT